MKWLGLSNGFRNSVEFLGFSVIAALFFSASLVLAQPTAAPTPLPAPAPAADVGDIGVLAITEGTQSCLQRHSVRHCTGVEPGTPEASQSGQHDPEGIDDRLDELRENFWRDRLGNTASHASNHLPILIGLRVGEKRLFEEEVVADPDKVATDRKLGGTAVWVRHNVEIRPELNQGISIFSLAGVIPNYVGLAVGVGATQIVRMVKRHALSREYGASFWEHTKKDLSLLTKTLPLTVRLPVTFAHERMMAGEEVEIERFGTISVFAGANILPFGMLGYGPLAIGIGARLGITQYLITNHFRTRIHAQEAGHVRVVLEKANVHGTGFFASIGPQIDVGILTTQATVLRFGAERTVTHDKWLDMTFNLAYPEAEKALRRAYVGDFTLAQQLSLEEPVHYRGVHRNSDHMLDEVSHERRISFLMLEKRSSYADLDERVVTYDAAGHPVTTHEHTQEMIKRGKGFFKKRDLRIALKNDVPEGGVGPEEQSLSFEYDFQDSHTDRDELTEILDGARGLAAPARAAQVSQLIREIKDKNGTTRAHVFVQLDAPALHELLDRRADKAGRFYAAFAEVMNLPNPQAWAAMTDDERNRLSKADGRLRTHFKHARKFLAAFDKGLGERGITFAKHVKKTLNALRNLTFDLYPIAAAARMSAREDVFSTVRVTYERHADRETTLRLVSLGRKQAHPPDALAFEPTSARSRD